MILETPLAVALNHLLRAESWARERLSPFAGQSVELRAPPLPRLRFTILSTGMVRGAATEAEPALVVTLRPESPIALLRGEDHMMRAVEVAGDPRLAEAVMVLVRHLRWDAEEDLSRVVGDAAAHGIAQGLRHFAAWQADTGRRLADSVAAYLTDETGLLLQRPELDAFAAEVSALRDSVERLEKRVSPLG